MISIFDLKEMEDEQLLSKIETTLSTFPTLKALYDQDFLADLVKKKLHYDNYLLWMLVSGHPFAKLTWEAVEKYLNLLKDADAILHFREKLRHQGKRVFQSYLTELEMAGYYKEKGYGIELEPQISGSKKNPDFKVEQDGLRVFFEVKNLFMDELVRMDDLDSQIHGRFGKIEERFVFGISYKPSVLQMRHLKPLQVFIKKKLIELDKSKDICFPLSFFFPDEKNAFVEVKVWGRPKKLEYGYLASLGLRTAFGLPQGGRNIRRKISKKISQLPKGEANVIVVELGHLFYNEIDVLDALFGDEKLRVSKRDFSTHVVRGRDRIFDMKKNTRLSAVVYYEKKFENQNFLVHKSVFHNPYATRPIHPDFFADKDVKQLVPIEEKDAYRMEWIES